MTAVRHPAMLTTGVLLVVFVSSVKMLSITVSHRRLLFFFFPQKSLEKRSNCSKNQNLHNCPDQQKNLCKRGGIDSVAIMLLRSSVSVQAEIGFGLNLGDRN